MRWMAVAGVALVSAGCAADADAIDEDATAPSTSADEVIAGRETFEHPEIGLVWKGGGLCTGTLVRPNVVLSAAHCVNGSPKDEDVTNARPSYAFEIRASANVTQRFAVDRIYSVPVAADFDGSQRWRRKDIALFRLTTNVPSSLARPAGIAPTWPRIGARVAIFGYGCTSRSAGANGSRPGTGTKRKLESSWSLGQAIGWTTTQNVCPGDSGGPLFDLDRNVVVGINSGYVGADDRFGDVPASVAIVESIANRWSR